MKESLFVKCGIVVSVILLFATIAQGAIKPISLTCEYMDNPTTVDVLSPRLSWINQAIPSSIRGEYQKAYRICVASSREKLLNGKADVWDTGKVNATDSYLIPFKGKSLESGKDYWWRVMVWDNKDKPSIWSNVAHWGMGLLFPSEWKAKWIGSSWRGTAPLLRKSFMVRKEVASAKAFVTGLGYFEFYLNGKRVGDDYLVPNFTTSTDREGLKTGYISIDTKFKNYRVLYLSYDVTHQLQVNRQNVIGAILGNGFYDINCSWTLPFGPVRFYCQLEITYKDGTKDIVCSDESWKAKRSPIVMNGIYDGEIYDANKEVSDWSSSQCDDSDWENVVLRETPTGKMTAQTSPSDKITEVLHPLSIKKQDNGKYLVSFGKQISGWVHLRNIHGQKRRYSRCSLYM
jgi:alpha-L-rhamnosidase